MLQDQRHNSKSLARLKCGWSPLRCVLSGMSRSAQNSFFIIYTARFVTSSRAPNCVHNPSSSPVTRAGHLEQLSSQQSEFQEQSLNVLAWIYSSWLVACSEDVELIQIFKHEWSKQLMNVLCLWVCYTHSTLPRMSDVIPSLVTKILSSSSLPVNSSATTYRSGRTVLATSSMN